ncbi:MAG: nicotinate-nucleotide adenylyltransferase [Endomicrobiia bacterium]|nr:nicotinate-nucleotide adenylyltransferase [Endomicrobiia bacterium]
MRIGIFGGSFDPPHNAHLAIARAAVDELSLDKLFFVPALRPPHAVEKNLTDPASRMEMLRAVVKGAKKFSIDDFELRRRAPTYTYETIERYRRMFPGARIFFVLGSDSMLEVPRWKKGSALVDMCRFAVAVRRPFKEHRLSNALVLKFRPSAISSTEIRRRVATRFLEKNVPPAVERIIRKKHLYLDGAITEYLLKHLDGAKFHHTMGVVSVAEKLAVKHGADPRRARLAALIHDMGRAVRPSRYLSYLKRAIGAALPSRATCSANPFLLHSFVSSRQAARLFGVKDREVLAAAANHTLGAPASSATIYDDIIYVADAVAPDRRYPGVSKIRKAAMRNLSRGVLLCAAMKLGYVLKKEKYLAPEGVSVYNSRLRPALYVDDETRARVPSEKKR